MKNGGVHDEQPIKNLWELHDFSEFFRLKIHHFPSTSWCVGRKTRPILDTLQLEKELFAIGYLACAYYINTMYIISYIYIICIIYVYHIYISYHIYIYIISYHIYIIYIYIIYISIYLSNYLLIHPSIHPYISGKRLIQILVTRLRLWEVATAASTDGLHPHLAGRIWGDEGNIMGGLGGYISYTVYIYILSYMFDIELYTVYHNSASRSYKTI